MLKIAILGNNQEQEGSEVWQQAHELTELVIKQGHEVFTIGATGIASAVIKGVENVCGNVKNKHYPQNSYFGYLEALYGMSKVWVFFPGYQATILQLHNLLHLIREDEIKMNHRRIILISEKESSFALGAKNFYLNVDESTSGVIKIPWTRTTRIPLVISMIEELEILISQKQSDSQQKG